MNQSWESKFGHCETIHLLVRQRSVRISPLPITLCGDSHTKKKARENLNSPAQVGCPPLVKSGC